MAFELILTPEAQSDIKRLDAAIQIRVLDKIEWICENVELLRHESLKGPQWSGYLKYRLGDYRIIYRIDRSIERFSVLKVGHRRDIYE